ncbi:hypothetical protein [Streptomyces sp. NPDC051211]|uniref:hypothetical protein n=1 Tax=Streptomyces sp. NPDC051211 TaxID=3154643 RepID=UPI00344EC691
MGTGPAPRRTSAAARATGAAALHAATLHAATLRAALHATLRAALLPALLATALAAALAGCSAPSGRPDPHPPDGTPPTTSAQELCTRLITHWSGVVLDGGEQAGLDYQAMGLSGDQNDILRAVVADARTAERTRGRAAARDLAAREAERRCVERHRSGTPTTGPWT